MTCSLHSSPDTGAKRKRVPREEQEKHNFSAWVAIGDQQVDTTD